MHYVMVIRLIFLSGLLSGCGKRGDPVSKEKGSPYPTSYPAPDHPKESHR